MPYIEQQDIVSTSGEQTAKTYRIFRQSFRFAQGDTRVLQTDILRWLIAKGEFDSDSIPEKASGEVLDIVAPLQHNPAFGTTADRRRTSVIASEWDILSREHAKYLSDPQGYPTPSELLPSILSGMLARDLHYQKHERIRSMEENAEKFEADSSSDPHASFLTKFALQGVTTRHMEYDALFADLGKLLREDLSELDTKTDLSSYSRLVLLAEFRKLWRENHPNESYF